MGCSTSKSSNAVHPARVRSSARPRTNIVHVQESPDAPSSTPEPADNQASSHSTPPTNSASPSPKPLPSPGPSTSMATELQTKLKHHAANTKKLKNPSRNRQRKVNKGGSDEVDHGTVPEASSGGHSPSASHVPKNLTLTGPTDPNLAPPPRHHHRKHGIVQSPQTASAPALAQSNHQHYRQRHRSYRLEETDSQVEFFKLLDRKIEMGPDYSQDAQN